MIENKFDRAARGTVIADPADIKNGLNGALDLFSGPLVMEACRGIGGFESP
jgi:hypothetical protein